MKRPAPGLLRPRSVWLMLVVAAVAGAVLVAPYLFGMDASRTPPRSDLHYALLVTHIGTAFLALVLGPLQFIPAVRAHRRVHRTIGRTYLIAGVLPSGLAGIPVAVLAHSPVTRVGLLIPAVAWLVTGGLALRAARRRDFANHRAWMMRNYALTFLAVTSRVVAPLLLLAQLPVLDSWYGGSVDAAIAATVPIGQWLGWIVNLAVVEILIRRRPVAMSKASPPVSR